MDVVIIYERKLRELENAILLKLELEKRGITCAVRQFYEVDSIKLNNYISPKVILAPHLYVSKSIPRIYSRFGKSNYIINLQYEQVLSKKWEKLGHHNPKDEAEKAFHICWGEKTRDRLIDSGIEEKNVKVLGALHLDLLREEFREKYFESKNLLSKKYNIPVEKKWTLFISSFTYADITDERLKMNESVANTKLDSFVPLHTDSRDKILSWFENILLKDTKNILIYRPHPDELSLDKVQDMERKYKNFYIIRDGSVKNWISTCDKIYSWYSTSVVESHYLDKEYSILRPFELPSDFDSVLLKHARFINTYDSFEEDYFSLNSNLQLPIENHLINQYYSYDYLKPSFELYADFIEKLYNGEGKQAFIINPIMRFKAKFTTISVWIVYRLYKMSNIDLNKYRSQRKNNFLISWFIEMDNQIATDKEKNEIENRLRKVLNR